MSGSMQELEALAAECGQALAHETGDLLLSRFADPPDDMLPGDLQALQARAQGLGVELDADAWHELVAVYQAAYREAVAAARESAP